MHAQPVNDGNILVEDGNILVEHAIFWQGFFRDQVNE